MQKKKIILLTTLSIIAIGIIALALSKTNKIKQIGQTTTAEYSTTIGETQYDIRNLVLEPSEIVPTISAGMIPIKRDGENWVIADKNDWCDYSNNQPAYMMLSDGYYKSELERGIKEEQLMQNNVGVAALGDPNLDIHTRHNLHVYSTIYLQ